MVLSTSLSLIFTVILYIYIVFIAIRLLDDHIPDELTFISPSKFGYIYSDQKKIIIKNDKTNWMTTILRFKLVFCIFFVNRDRTLLLRIFFCVLCFAPKLVGGFNLSQKDWSICICICIIIIIIILLLLLLLLSTVWMEHSEKSWCHTVPLNEGAPAVCRVVASFSCVPRQQLWHGCRNIYIYTHTYNII